MITFTRTYTAQPGKFFDLIAQSKENAAIVKKVVGLEVSTNVVSGGVTGELVGVLKFKDFAHYEEVVNKLLSNAEYRDVLDKFAGLIVPGSARDQLMREI